MSITRTGKIARLPKYIRDQLGERIENGEQGKVLVNWLNGLSDVKEVLRDQFGGRPINEQNLSEWKQGGHPEWRRQEETRLLACRLTEHSDDLVAAADGKEISDRFASLLAVEVARLATDMLENETDLEKRWQRVCHVNRELSQLRRDDHRATRTLIERQRWTREVDGEDEKKKKDRLTAPFWAYRLIGPYGELFGGGDEGRAAAAFVLEAERGMRPGTLDRFIKSGPTTAPVKPDQAESNPIKPDQA
jgi:hypothetical protein